MQFNSTVKVNLASNLIKYFDTNDYDAEAESDADAETEPETEPEDLLPMKRQRLSGSSERNMDAPATLGNKWDFDEDLETYINTRSVFKKKLSAGTLDNYLRWARRAIKVAALEVRVCPSRSTLAHFQSPLRYGFTDCFLQYTYTLMLLCTGSSSEALPMTLRSVV